ncbi:MAG: thiolase family protein [Bacillota bacterium]
MRDCVLIDGVRTIVGKKGGGLATIRPDDLAGLTLAELVRRTGIEAGEVEDVIMGCVTQTGEQGYNIARLATMIAGFPVEVPAVSLNRMCGSSQQAIHFASQAIRSGDMDVVIAAGVESMTRVPMGSDGVPFSERLLARFNLVWQGEAAERIADQYQISREEMDRWALLSHQRALKAWQEGRFERETFTPVPGLVKDEGPRPDTDLEKLGALKTVFRPEGRVTAGNASQISDGAAAVLLADSKKAAKLGLKPRARMVATAVVGSDPLLMLDGPIPATRKVLAKAGLSLQDIDIFEINEAFASVVLAWQKTLEIPTEKININGGAIALGHPLGASGARIMTTLINLLEQENKRYGLMTMCIGHGMATATIIERI